MLCIRGHDSLVWPRPMSLPQRHVTSSVVKRRFVLGRYALSTPQIYSQTVHKAQGGDCSPTLQFLSGTCAMGGSFGSRLLHDCGNGGVLKEGFPLSARIFDCIMCQVGGILARVAISSLSLADADDRCR